MRVIALLALFLAVQRIGRLAVPRGADARGDAALAACIGMALVLVTLSPLAARMSLGVAVPASLGASFVIAALLARVPAAAAPGVAHRGWRLELTVLLLIGLVALRGYFFDELDHHLPCANEILRGHYPPPYPFLPQAHHAYHFGYDLLAAALVQVSALATYHAFDVLTVLLVLLTVRLASAIAAESGVKGAASSAGLLVLLGGGLAWAAYPADLWHAGRFDLGDAFARPFYHLEYQPWQAPPIASYFYQHPMSLGMPLWLALLRCWTATAASAGVDRWALLAGVCFGALSLSQLSFFYLAIPVLVSGVVIRTALRGGLAWPGVLTVLSIGAVLHALGTGGQGSVVASGSTVGLRWPPHLGWAEAAFPGYLAAFGVPGLLALAGAWRAARGRSEIGLLLAVAGAGAFVAPHVVEFRQSPWNTVKFFVAAQLSAALLAAPVIAAWRASGRQLAVAIALAASIGSPLLFLWVRLLGPLGIDPKAGPIPQMLFPPPAGGHERIAAEWLGPRAALDDVVLAASLHFTAFSGVPSFAPQPASSEVIIGFFHYLDPVGAIAREHQQMWAALEAAALDARGIAWVAVGPQERKLLGAKGRARLADAALFQRVFETGEGAELVEVYRRVARPPARR